MKENIFLTFSLHGLLLAVDTRVVEQIIWLPELTVIEECPSYIAGVVNLHGKVLPIMDLNLRFGRPQQRYNCSDRVVILDLSESNLPDAEYPYTETKFELQSRNAEPKLLGIIVNDVLDVINIEKNNIELPPFKGRGIESNPPFVSGIAKSDESIIMILNLRTLLHAELEIEEPVFDPSAGNVPDLISYFCPEADQREKKIFRNRSTALQKTLTGDDSADFLPIAVVSLQGEYFGVELRAVKEFSWIDNITPVPCCPEHIIGNMNLRGHVLTVVDIRSLFNLQSSRISESTKVIVVDTGGFSVGVIVDEILDIIDIKTMDMVPVPSSVKVLDDNFVKGAVSYGNRMITLFDLKEILAWNGLTVNEEV